MSPTQKKQKNSNAKPTKIQKIDNSAQSKLSKPSASTVNTDESTKTRETTPSPSTDEKSEPSSPDEAQNQITADLYARCHHVFVSDNYLSELIESMNASNNSAQQKIYQNAIAAVQIQTKQAEKGITDVPLVENLYQKVVDEAEEKLQTFEGMENDLNQDYTTMFHILNENVKSIGDKHILIEENVDKTIDQHKLFDRKDHWNIEQLDKVCTSKDFSIAVRDNVCERISQSNKTLSKMSDTTQNLRKTNGLLKQQIGGIKHKFDDEDVAMVNITKNASQWLNEKSETGKKMKLEKNQLKKEQDKMSEITADVKIQHENLCSKESKLTKEVTEQEKLNTRVKVANENLRDDQTMKLETEKKVTLLHSDSKAMADDAARMQSVTDKKQLLFDNIHRIKKEVLMNQQKRTEYHLKLGELDREIWKQDHKLKIMTEYVYGMKSDIGRSASKRARLSPTVTTTDDREIMMIKDDEAIDSSVFGLNDMETESVEAGSVINLN